MRWFTSDHHFGHLRICEMNGRPFAPGAAGIGEMNEELIRRYRARVQPADIAWFPGDFAMGAITETLPIIGQLPGHERILKAGNHDRCSPAYWHIREDEQLGHATERSWKRLREWFGTYMEAGFTAIFNGAETAEPILEIAGTPVRIDHFPYRGGGDSKPGQERFSQYRPQDQGGWLICGHVHNAWRQHGRMINVGVDAWGGYPVSEDQIAELIAAGPRELGVLPWD